MTTPYYSFLPWLRSGVANSIISADGDTAVQVRAILPVELTLTATHLDGTAFDQTLTPQQVHLYGPGDIIGIQPRAIVKVDPRDWITNFESNYLPYVEFYDEDFPWRYTPAAADLGQHRLRPWIALIVLARSEFDDGKDMTGKPLPYIDLKAGVDANKVFPAPSELWAWAHVHANVDLTSNGTGTTAVTDLLEKTLAQNADLAYSRLLCPRRLQPNTDYHAFVIPSFETGRLAGLGQEIPAETVATASAWDSGQTRFPHYHRWYFRTGDFGDFEYLVKLLKPGAADKRVGARDLDTTRPGSNLPKIDVTGLGGVLKLGGALQVPLDTLPLDDQKEVKAYDHWDDPPPHDFEKQVAAQINLADDYTRDGAPDPVVTLPLYGRWPALTNRIDTALSIDDHWIHRLNLDPRFRVAAGLGTRVVRENDQKYMEAAWQQIGEVIAVNTQLRHAQLAQAASLGIHRRHVAGLAPERQFVLTAPLHARVVGAKTTVAEQVRVSIVPPAVTSGAFRRLTRAGTPMARGLGLSHGAAASIVTGINEGKLVAAPEKGTPDGGITIKAAEDNLPQLPPVPHIVADVASAIGASQPSSVAKFAVLGEAILEQNQIPAAVDAIPVITNFVITRPETPFTPTYGQTESDQDSPEAVAFKTALRDVFTFVSADLPAPTATLPSLDLPGLSQLVVKALDPGVTVPQRMGKLISLPSRFTDSSVSNPVETLSPVMAYPVFDLPMYKPLGDISSELLLPNINLVPPNSLMLLEANPRFIEAYMVGLNHEMARELLWQEYPTDQRGSYFRQFWDVGVSRPPNPTAAEKDQLRDIFGLNLWEAASVLGTHNARAQNNAPKPLVLVIRGELLKRYPTAMIYAQKANWHTSNGAADPTANRELVTLSPDDEDNPPPDKILKPMFEAKVDPDIYFLGFDLSAAVAKGGTLATDDAGWFFVIKERSGEPRFGMDDVPAGTNPPLINWNDLAWGDVGTAPGEVIRLDKSLTRETNDPNPGDGDDPDPEDDQANWNPGTNAADLAYILYRLPVMVAVHASRMLP